MEIAEQKTEYSKSFDFFLKEQIGVACQNKGRYVKFFSRLDGTLFKTVDGLNEMTQQEIKETCVEIYAGLPKSKEY